MNTLPMAATSSSTTTAAVLLQDVPLSVFRPMDFLQSHCMNDVRPDGRSLRQARPVTLKPHPNSFSYEVQIGGSVVHCVVKVLVGTPSNDLPDCGDIGKTPFN